MATPRKRHFRVADAILREPWPREQKLTLVLLMAYLNARWRRDGIPNSEAGRAPISRGTLCDITGKSGVVWGVVALRKLSEIVTISVEIRDGIVWVDWPKFAEFQSFGSPSQGKVKARSTPDSAPSDAPSGSGSGSGSVQEQEKSAAGRAQRSNRASRKTTAPDELEPAAQARVVDWIVTMLGPAANPEALIEGSLDFLGGRGDRCGNWERAVRNNLRAKKNAERERNGDPPLGTVAEARKLRAFAEEGRRRNAEFMAEEAAKRAAGEPEFELPMRQVAPGLKVAQ